MKTFILDRPTLRVKTKTGAIQNNALKEERETNVRKDIESRAKRLFEKEIPSVIAEIKRRTSKGYDHSFYPILRYKWDEKIWQDTGTWKNTGEKRIEVNYRLEKLNLCSIYKVSDFQPYGDNKRRYMQYEDSDSIVAAVTKLTARHIARSILKNGLDVVCGEWDVCMKAGVEGSSTRKLSFLKISWK